MTTVEKTKILTISSTRERALRIVAQDPARAWDCAHQAYLELLADEARAKDAVTREWTLHLSGSPPEVSHLCAHLQHVRIQLDRSRATLLVAAAEHVAIERALERQVPRRGV